MPIMLSHSEIEARFQGEWILLADPQTTSTLEITGGTVLWHSKDRDEVYRKARELRPAHSAVFYAGSPPVDAVIIL